MEEALRLASAPSTPVVVFNRPGEFDRSELVSSKGDLDWSEALASPAGDRGHDCVDVEANEPLYILYTSGTTGEKLFWGMLLSSLSFHGVAVTSSAAVCWHEYYPLDSAVSANVLLPVPLTRFAGPFPPLSYLDDERLFGIFFRTVTDAKM